jgi:hypothetical protein
MKQLTLFLFVSIFLTNFANAETQVHRVYGLNLETVSNCEAMIDNIATQLENKHNVDVVGSFCETSTVTNRTTGVISYDADEPLKEVSTYTIGAIYASKGIFQTKQRCEQMLQQEILIFQTNTGLSETYAFCSKESLQSDNSWFPHITAFGVAKKIPYRSFWHSDMPYGIDSAQIKTALNQYYQNQAAEFVHVTYRDTGASGQLTSLYYAEPEYVPLTVHQSVVATIPGLLACTSNVSRFRDEGVGIDDRPLILSYCSSGYSNPRKFELVLLHETSAYLDSFLHSEKFFSLDLCESARPSIEAELRTVYGNKLVTTICGHERFSLSIGPPFSIVAIKQY